LVADGGRDTLRGGPGADTFIDVRRGEDRVFDYKPGEDEIRYIDGPPPEPPVGRPPPAEPKRGVPDFFGLLERNQNDDKYIDNEDFEIAEGLREGTREELARIREDPNYDNLPKDDRDTLDTLLRIVNDPSSDERVPSSSAEEARQQFLIEHPDLFFV
jgi:hypothetical protein